MLDEATSALDTHTEQEIQDNVWNIGEGRTLLIIAHRLSTITHADQIIVLHAGEIVERGTHDELLDANGRYASMWEKQIRAERALDAAREAHLKAARARADGQTWATKTPEEATIEDYHSIGSSGRSLAMPRVVVTWEKKLPRPRHLRRPMPSRLILMITKMTNMKDE
ncbi:ATP-binding cassette-type vacuolar membrane transporter Hmt1 [Metarhizium acridum]|nr:ATP-binding cassette-type vacuolar membrane transporter Hmt1 [Metarhizium acridum]